MYVSTYVNTNAGASAARELLMYSRKSCERERESPRPGERDVITAHSNRKKRERMTSIE